MDCIKCEEAAKYFRSKIVQFQWEEEVKKDMELVALATNIPDEEIENDFHLLMQAVKQQCAISLVNNELAKEGKALVPDVILPDQFPKPDVRRKSDYISFVNNDSLTLAKRKTLQFSKICNFPSMPNMNLSGKNKEEISKDSNNATSDQPKLMELLNAKSKIDSTRYLAYNSHKNSENNASSTATVLNLFHSASTSDLSRKYTKIKRSLEKIQSFDGLSKLKSNVRPTAMRRYEKEILLKRETGEDFNDFLLFQTESVV